MKITRTLTVYAVLIAAWIVVGLWQLLEHGRAKDSARDALRSRARGISYALAAVIRSQEFFGRVRQDRLEAALRSIVKSEELQSVALLNASGDVVVFSGEPLGIRREDIPSRDEWWEKRSVTFTNLIDLGSEVEGGESERPAIIVSRDEPPGPPPERRGPPAPRHHSIRKTSDSTILVVEYPLDEATTGSRFFFRGRPDGPPESRRPEPSRVTTSRTSDSTLIEFYFPADQPTTPLLAYLGPERGRDEEGFRGRRGDRGRPDGSFRGGRRPPPFFRPPWMDETEYQALLQKQGLHGFVLKMRTDVLRAEVARDTWLRLVVMNIALVAVAGIGLARRQLERSAQLQIRLTRASEMNAYLREMNVAAAGLAHETRNPLNIVRGLAQMIGKAAVAPPEVCARSGEIVEEVDRVTARLNEFIDYSKPREAKPAPTNLAAIIRDVERTLESDISDKGIAFRLEGPELIVEADESLLRQVLFNLLLNAVQAVGQGGKVEVLIDRQSAQETALEVRDDGPGVPEEAVRNLFRPYYTTHDGGTGLGLAIVRQIVLAHGWDIQYMRGQPQGARFRISGLRVRSA